MNVTLKANKKFILNNEGTIEYKTTEFGRYYSRGIYFTTLDGIKYKVHPRTFSSIISYLERFHVSENNDTTSVFYKVNT